MWQWREELRAFSCRCGERCVERGSWTRSDSLRRMQFTHGPRMLGRLASSNLIHHRISPIDGARRSYLPRPLRHLRSMPYSPLATEFEVTIEPESPAVATVILLHGLGADGWDFVPIVEELRLPLPVRFIFPHATERPVTVNAGYVMRAWYDIKSFTPEGRADAAGLADSVQRMNGYLDAEIARGVASRANGLNINCINRLAGAPVA